MASVFANTMTPLVSRSRRWTVKMEPYFAFSQLLRDGSLPSRSGMLSSPAGLLIAIKSSFSNMISGLCMVGRINYLAGRLDGRLEGRPDAGRPDGRPDVGRPLPFEGAGRCPGLLPRDLEAAGAPPREGRLPEFSLRGAKSSLPKVSLREPKLLPGPFLSPKSFLPVKLFFSPNSFLSANPFLPPKSFFPAKSFFFPNPSLSVALRLSRKGALEVLGTLPGAADFC